MIKTKGKIINKTSIEKSFIKTFGRDQGKRILSTLFL